MRSIAGFAIVGLFMLPGLTWWCGEAAAEQPPEFWQRREVVVRVIDLPDTAMFRRGPSSHIDLGYHFQPDGTGVWVGYASSGAHEPLDAVSLGMTMAAAGLNELPPPPQRPASFLAYAFFAAIALSIMAVIGRFMLGQRLAALRTNRRKNSMLHGDISAPEEKTPAGVRQAMKKAAEKKRAVERAAKQAKAMELAPEPKLAPVIAQRGIEATAKPNAKFGRRGW